MKSVAVLAVLCCLALGLATASPVPERSNDAAKTVNALDVKATGRQAAVPAAPVPASTEDDDDDDDDDDDIDIGLDEDDDDDDDEEDGPDDDDDDDEDILERFIDDILGGDEDDDDDDETSSVVEPVVPAAPVQPVQPVQAAPSIPAAVQADLNALNAEAAAEEAATLAENSAVETEGASYEDEETADVVPEGQAASSLEAASSSGIEESQQIPTAVITSDVPVIPQQAPAGDSDEDDDDDDDDDDDLGEIADIGEDDDDDDDDDEDEDDEDDDDDDDDVSIPDIARRARAMESEPNSHVPAIYVAKYNRFVDNILGRINKILKANYDPVTVKLSNPSTSTKSNKTKSKKKKSTKKKGTKSASKQLIANDSTESTQKLTTPAAPKDAGEKMETATTIAITEPKSNAVPDAVATTPSSVETVQNLESRNAAATSTKKPKRKRNKVKTRTQNKKKAPTSGSSTSNKNKTKVKKTRKPSARATLYGLSSLKRSGDVSVNMMSDHTTIRTKFSLGPLVLKVEKEFGRAAKKDLRSATATTAEMSGKLSLRVLHGGAATLHSIKVLQPKQVRVESDDDHDRTREFVWRRSSHIAHLVSQKLSSATRSMLRPPPLKSVIAA